MKKIIILLLALSVSVAKVSADEGMWLLPLLEKMNIKQMKDKGLKLTASDIYNLNGNSLKDAVVLFGGGCTGEIVSPEGLLLTNHHCGFGSIQELSSVEHDYLKNGFWAMNRAEELPAPGLSVKFMRKIEDVTDRALASVSEGMEPAKRKDKITDNILSIQQDYEKSYPGKSILIKNFFGGNQYLLFVIDEYKDVRLVGAPPTSIGKFGGDTDNWMWPRHTGDFSMFRVYSNEKGEPAEYSKDNVPYRSPSHLKVSLKGYKEGDFAMIMGFPGSTNRYMTSFEIDQVLDVSSPVRVFVRGVRQDILAKDMAASDKVRIQYASKYARSSNYWKNSIGMSRGLKRLNVKAEKQKLESDFAAWTAASPERAVYSPALDKISQAVKGRTSAQRVNQYLSEALLGATEILGASNLAAALRDSAFVLSPENIAKLKNNAAKFYKDYNEETDRKVAKAMFRIIADSLATADQPSFFESEINAKFGGNTDAYVDYLYSNSNFANQQKFDTFIGKATLETLKADPVYVAMTSIKDKYNSNFKANMQYDELFTEGHRLYVAGLVKMQSNKNNYPDANLTIRLTYGSVLPYKPADAVSYDFYTTLSGVIEKEDASNPVEFTVPARLKELYKSKDFGRYAYKGDVPVAFITNNDITGGNSGSPVLNSRGELLGLAFDGNWEAMSGDIAFEPDLQRTINVDIRYVLFIIDKFAGAGYLIDEMTIAK